MNSINLKANITIIVRYPDGSSRRIKSHNIWLDTGRNWLLQLMSYQAGSNGSPPWQSYHDFRVGFIGLGIGGNRQTGPIPDDVGADYPGTNEQNDTTLTTIYLERPVRVTETGGDTWLKEVTSPPTFNPNPPPYYVTYSCTFTGDDINYNKYASVPLSEVGIFSKDVLDNGHVIQPYNQVYPVETSNRPHPLAYDTFTTINKTQGVSIEVQWTIQM